jgi:hypothetical protein
MDDYYVWVKQTTSPSSWNADRFAHMLPPVLGQDIENH